MKKFLLIMVAACCLGAGSLCAAEEGKKKDDGKRARRLLVLDALVKLQTDGVMNRAFWAGRSAEEAAKMLGRRVANSDKFKPDVRKAAEEIENAANPVTAALGVAMNVMDTVRLVTDDAADDKLFELDAR